jgi:hypothetical protein
MFGKLGSPIITGLLLVGTSQLCAQAAKDVVIVQTNGTAITTQASGGQSRSHTASVS